MGFKVIFGAYQLIPYAAMPNCSTAPLGNTPPETTTSIGSVTQNILKWGPDMRFLTAVFSYKKKLTLGPDTHV
jgi:hypothetical protein